MPEIVEPAQRGLTRRTALKGAAWSVPVVAAAIAVPAYAASALADIQLAGSAGDGYQAISPDGTRGVKVGITTGYVAFSDVEIPAGATLVLSTDTRNLIGPKISINGTVADGTTTTSGNVRTTTVVIAVAIPAGGYDNGVYINVSYDSVDQSYFEDLNPVVLTLVAPAGVTDTNGGNNSVSSQPVYGDVIDLSLAVSAGDTLSGTTPTGGTWTLDTPTDFVASSEVAVPAGTELQLWFDSRILGDPTVTAAGTVLTPTNTDVYQNRTTQFYSLPAVPAGAYPAGLAFSIDFGTRTTGSYSDLESYGIAVRPGDGFIDSNFDNDQVTNSPAYS